MVVGGVMDRFWSKVEKTDGCWNWTAVKNQKGYGRFKLDGRLRSAHRVSYEMCVGPIPDGLVIDHLCRNPSCVRPDHLEAVTSGENTRRGDTGKHERERTHCPRGHEYNETNTRIYKGWRHCRACDRDRKRSAA